MESLPSLFYTAPRALEHTTFLNKGQFSISQWFSSLLSAGTTQKLTSMELSREALPSPPYLKLGKFASCEVPQLKSPTRERDQGPSSRAPPSKILPGEKPQTPSPSPWQPVPLAPRSHQLHILWNDHGLMSSLTYTPSSRCLSWVHPVLCQPSLSNFSSSFAMALESGKYMIVSKLDDAPVGRRNPENLGTDPKGIFKLPNNIGSQDITSWVVEKLENGNYKFKANHSLAVGAIDGLLFAILFEHQLAGAAIEWTLKRDERDTEGNAYVVTVADQGDGWVAPSGDNEQIAVKPIVVGLSFPPTYLPNTLFVFKKIE